MYRDALKKLEKWKDNPERKPLILEGARQVGKTWLLNELGRTHYGSVAYVNFERREQLKSIFDGDLDPKQIISDLALATGTEIEPGKTLIVLDEVQECPRALTSLKYFCEEAPDYHIAVAGSLLGVAMHEGFSFPVGKVDTLKIYPLSFNEFLRAIGQPKMAERLESREYDSLMPFHDQLIKYLKTYMITGGMPEVVQDYVKNGDLLNTREIQKQINADYARDFSKHTDERTVPRISEIFDIIPAELARENKRFIFRLIRESARSREYETALLWLSNAGITTRVECVGNARLPLSSYADKDIFKLYMLDIGLLGAKANLDPKIIFEDDKLFTEFKGAFVEQFVFQELACHGITPYYYGESDARREVDFIIDHGGEILPIEVKSGKNVASASLKSLLEKNPKIKRAIKMSLLPYVHNDIIDNMPLYFAGMLAATR